MKAITLLLILSCGFAAISEAQDLEARTPISVELNLDSRASYEALAERAGLNVVFTRTFRPAAAAPFRADNVSAAEALDLLAKQTKTFWVPWDQKTILALEDNQQNRRDYERQFLASLSLGTRSQSLVIEELRGRGFRQVAAAGPGNTIFVRDTAAQIRLAESAIANTNAPAALLDLSGMFLTENGGMWRTPESLRTELKVKSRGPLSLNVNESSRTTFETLARNAGVHILFGRTYRPSTVRLAVKDVGLFEALDLLCLASGSFWQPVNDNTFMVFEDNQQNRRDFQAHTAETIYLPAGISIARFNEILNNLRTVLQLRGIFQNTAANAIVIHDTPSRVALAETMVAEMTGGPVAFRKRLITDLRTAFSENGGGSFHTAASDRARLQIKTSGPISLDSSNSREAFEKLAVMAGLNVVFGANFRPNAGDYSIQDVDVVEAMDLLSFQSGTFWQPLDGRTILVLEDNQQNRRDYRTHLVKTISLPRDITTNDLNGILNVLRTALAMRGVFQSEDAKAIVIHDTPQRMALAETVIEHLNTFSTPSKPVDIPAPRYAENGIYGMAAAARPDLKLKTTGPVSINLSQDSRTTYEALADLAGLTVNFSADFRPGAPLPFHLEGVDVLDTLDYLSLMTKNSWKAVDAQTILVFSDNQQNHRDLDTQVTKTFNIANRTSPNTIAGIVNVLRTAMAVKQVQPGDGSITVQDTPQKVAIAEKIIASLDRVP